MPARKKTNKGGHYHKYEPMDMNFLNEDPTAMEFFKRTGCLQFCQRLQGFLQFSKDFANSFTGRTSKVGILNLTVTPDNISSTTGIHKGGEKWFKSIKFTIQDYKEFIKPEHSEIDLTNAIPRGFMKDNYSKLLMIIQKYFTCEG